MRVQIYTKGSQRDNKKGFGILYNIGENSSTSRGKLGRDYKGLDKNETELVVLNIALKSFKEMIKGTEEKVNVIINMDNLVILNYLRNKKNERIDFTGTTRWIMCEKKAEGYMHMKLKSLENEYNKFIKILEELNQKYDISITFNWVKVNSSIESALSKAEARTAAK